MISAFGARAEQYARGLENTDAVVFEPGYLGNAYVESVRRREKGEAFYALFLYDDPRCSLVGIAAPQIVAQAADHDKRLQIFGALASGDLTVDGKPAREAWSKVPSEIDGWAPELFALADGILVRSFVEYARLAPFCRRGRPMERVLVEPQLPPIPNRFPSPSIVVWAPHRLAAGSAFEAFAFVEFPGAVTVICADGEQLASVAPVRFMTPDHPECPQVLGAAGVVVCPDLGDPGAAVAFARQGWPVVAPTVSGAVEWIAGLASYDAASPRSLWDAVSVAFGRGTSQVRPNIRPPKAPEIPKAITVSGSVPLITVVIPTYNRRADVDRVLEGLRAQTYPNVEVVVANDAGELIDDVVDKYDFARVVNLSENGGAIKATMFGLREARGEYIQFLADDDWLFPDHLERLAAALFRSNAAAAHGNTLIRYQEADADGAWRTVGFNTVVFVESTTPTEALISTPIAGQAMLVRRDVFDKIGGWREDTFLADQEFQFRLWRHYPVVWIDNVTAEWRVRGKENFSGKVESGPELQRIFDEFHPVEGRPILEANRRATIENVLARPPGYIFPATIRLTSQS